MNAEEGPAERNATTLTDQRSHTNATFVAEIVSPTSVSTATSDAATIKQTGQPLCTPMINLDRKRPYIDSTVLTYSNVQLDENSRLILLDSSTMTGQAVLHSTDLQVH